MGKGISKEIQYSALSWLLFWDYDPWGPKNTIAKTGIQFTGIMLE